MYVKLLLFVNIITFLVVIIKMEERDALTLHKNVD